MRLEQLQAFLLVAERGSFQQAALEVGVNQSTISRQIHALERELAAQLFHRGAQAKLTLAGKILLERARRICQEWQSVSEELRELHQGKQSEFCLAAIYSVCKTNLPPLLLQFCRHYPQIQLRVTALGSDRALKVLQDGLVDLAIVMHQRHLVQRAGLVVRPLYTEPIGLLMAVNHPLAGKETLTWAEIASYPQVVFKEGYGMRRLIEEEFLRRCLPLTVALELNTPDAFSAIVHSSPMIALLPQSILLEAAKQPGLTICYCPPGELIQRQVAIVTTTDRLNLPPVADFFHLVTNKLCQP